MFTQQSSLTQSGIYEENLFVRSVIYFYFAQFSFKRSPIFVFLFFSIYLLALILKSRVIKIHTVVISYIPFSKTVHRLLSTVSKICNIKPHIHYTQPTFKLFYRKHLSFWVNSMCIVVCYILLYTNSMYFSDTVWVSLFDMPYILCLDCIVYYTQTHTVQYKQIFFSFQHSLVFVLVFPIRYISFICFSPCIVFLYDTVYRETC